MNISKLHTIIKRYNEGVASPEEVEFIEKWYEGIDNDSFEFKNEEHRDYLKNQIYTGFKEQTSAKKDSADVVSIFKTFLPAWWAAAILLIAISFGLYVGLNTTTNNVSKNYTNIKEKVIAPGGNKAILTLADSSKILLDNANTGMLAQQGLANVKKLKDGQVVFETVQQTQAVNSRELQINTLSTPRGGQYQIILPDGSKVWLNAASNLRFPSAFTSNERKVELSGEAYFEVAKNTDSPFKISVNDVEVEVLGTHFNIMAYSGENSINTTLLEGSVKVSKGSESRVIIPGQQARINQNIQVSNVDTEDAVAWKNGLTAFKNANIQSIMRQIERWYDVDVSYEGTIPQRLFTGEISRTANLSELLKVLELSDINFEVEGRRVFVKP